MHTANTRWRPKRLVSSRIVDVLPIVSLRHGCSRKLSLGPMRPWTEFRPSSNQTLATLCALLLPLLMEGYVFMKITSRIVVDPSSMGKMRKNLRSTGYQRNDSQVDQQLANHRLLGMIPASLSALGTTKFELGAREQQQR